MSPPERARPTARVPRRRAGAPRFRVHLTSRTMSASTMSTALVPRRVVAGTATARKARAVTVRAHAALPTRAIGRVGRRLPLRHFIPRTVAR